MFMHGLWLGAAAAAAAAAAAGPSRWSPTLGGFNLVTTIAAVDLPRPKSRRSAAVTKANALASPFVREWSTSSYFSKFFSAMICEKPSSYDVSF